MKDKAFEYSEVIARFIAYGMAGKPGWSPGFIGGLLRGHHVIAPQVVGDQKCKPRFPGGDVIIGLVAGATLWNLLKEASIAKLFNR